MPRGYETLIIEDFTGGWNPRDSWSQVAENESPDMLNVTLDERGGVVKRLGLTKLNGSDQIVNTGNVQSLHYSAAIDRMIAQVGADLYVSSDGGANWGTSVKTFTTSERCAMVDFLGKVVVAHPTDRCFTYDGTTFSAAIANSPKASALAVWLNAVWSVGDPANASRVTRSDLGAHTWPASPVTVDVRVKDDKALTAIGGGQGMDTQGRSGLLVFKANSTYRIFDSATGEYTLVDHEYGAQGPACTVTTNSVTAAISTKGIITITGGDGTPTLVSHKLNPLFVPLQLSFAQANTMCAAAYYDRMVFSLPWDGSTVNNMTLEYSPREGWFAPHDFGCSSFTNYTKDTFKLVGGKVGTAAASYGYVLDVFTGATDDGTTVVSRFQSPWYEPNSASRVRIRRAILNARGTLDFYAKLDYTTGVGELFPVSVPSTVTGGLIWGSGVWGQDVWATTIQQDYVELHSLGHGSAFSFEVQDSSTTTHTGQALLDVGGAPTQGAFALYGVVLDMVSLGRSR